MYMEKNDFKIICQLHENLERKQVRRMISKRPLS